jgi:hypothetical protein
MSLKDHIVQIVARKDMNVFDVHVLLKLFVKLHYYMIP